MKTLAQTLMSRDSSGQISHRRAHVDVVAAFELKRPKPADSDSRGSTQLQYQQVAPPVIDFLLQMVPRYFEGFYLRRQRQIAFPPDRDRKDHQFVSQLEKRPAEVEIRVIVRHEPLNPRCLDQEEHGATCSTAVESRQLDEMLPSSFRDGIGEHGDSAIEERARLDLEIKIALIPSEKKIKTTPAERHLPPNEIESAKLRNPLLFDESPSHSIGQVRIQENRSTVTLDGENGMIRFPSPFGARAQVKRRSG
jgi:hypothetical protein